METWELTTIAVMWIGSGLVTSKAAMDQIDDHFGRPLNRAPSHAFIIIGGLFGGPVFGLIGLLLNRMCGISRKTKYGQFDHD